jgi:hypothetical protein
MLFYVSGPEFVPMNGICRSFPQSILKLLEGGKTADNRLCTTLFCISSALKKLSQCTPLPESWYTLPWCFVHSGREGRCRCTSQEI